jgi:branched-chain amino acid transport system substrate-binding protein
MSEEHTHGHPIGRRQLFALAGGGLAVAALAACGQDDDDAEAPSTTTGGTQPGTTTPGTPAGTAPGTTVAGTTPGTGITGGGGGDGTIRLGYVSPKTGPLAPFAASDDFILGGVREFLADGLMVGGMSYAVEIIEEDSESVPDTAASRATKLLTEDQVDLLLVASTPETTNPVSDVAEGSGKPCITTMVPWQPWLIGRGGTPGPDPSFQWTYHFFWGLEDVIGTFLAMWDQVETNKSVGGLFPNDGDGNAWGDPEVGFPPPLAEAGYTLTDPGRYENGNQDFTPQINAFKEGNCEIITGVVIPPDFPVFWRQAKQQGFTPKAASIGKALLFPDSIQALGADGVGLTSEVWWSPHHPYTSSLTGASAQQLADAYTADTGLQWTQPIGFIHALFEVVIATLVTAGSTEPQAIVDAVSALSLDTVVGPVAWGGADNPSPNIAKTKLVGGQWREADTPTGYDLIVVDNSGNPDVPTAGEVEPIA